MYHCCERLFLPSYRIGNLVEDDLENDLGQPPASPGARSGVQLRVLGAALQAA